MGYACKLGNNGADKPAITPGKGVIQQQYSVSMRDLPFSVTGIQIFVIVNCKDVKTASFNGYYGETPSSFYLKDGAVTSFARTTSLTVDKSADLLIAFYPSSNWGTFSYTV